MSKYTVEEVLHEAELLQDMPCGHVSDMLRDLAIRIRQEEEEMKRDPVTDPRPGDRIVYQDNRASQIYAGNAWLLDDTHWTKGRKEALKKGATIIRRRESP